MKITKQYLRRIISEYRKGRLNEYSEYESHADLSDHMEDMLEMLDDVMIKYVDRPDLMKMWMLGWVKDKKKFLKKDIRQITNESFTK